MVLYGYRKYMIKPSIASQILDSKITVCNKCFQASCWQGETICDEYEKSDMKRMTVMDLIKMKLSYKNQESPEYWKTDKEIEEGILSLLDDRNDNN